MIWDYYTEDPCYVPVEEIEKYESAKEWLVELLHHIYETGDIDALEVALEEAIHPFGLKLPEGEPVIKSNKSTYFEHAIEMIRGLKQ